MFCSSSGMEGMMPMTTEVSGISEIVFGKVAQQLVTFCGHQLQHHRREVIDHHGCEAETLEHAEAGVEHTHFELEDQSQHAEVAVNGAQVRTNHENSSSCSSGIVLVTRGSTLRSSRKAWSTWSARSFGVSAVNSLRIFGSVIAVPLMRRAAGQGFFEDGHVVGGEFTPLSRAPCSRSSYASRARGRHLPSESCYMNASQTAHLL